MLTHFITQPPPIFDRHVAPAGWCLITPNFMLPLPVLAHLFPHLPALFRWHVTPASVRPSTARRAQKAQQREEKEKTGFHGNG